MDSLRLQQFSNDLIALKREAFKNLSRSDYLHLRKVIWINRILFLLGYSTAWIMPNPISMICISLAMYGQWSIVTHHACHGGYDHVPSAPERYHSSKFAMGWRRFIDWFDWIYPPAWKYEHNTMHHFNTNEKTDPDLVSTRIKQFINPNYPYLLRIIVICFHACIWKELFYSLNTLKAANEKKHYNAESGLHGYIKQALVYNYIPYVNFYFILLPLLFYPLGWWAVFSVLINRIGADILTNIHSFLTILPNHAGADLHLQPTHFKNINEFFLYQIQSTANFKTGGFWNDYMHGYLNYQIEHHLFPDLPPSQYVILQPKVKSLCAKYGINYIQESVFKRIGKTFNIMTMREIMTEDVRLNVSI